MGDPNNAALNDEDYDEDGMAEWELGYCNDVAVAQLPGASSRAGSKQHGAAHHAYEEPQPMEIHVHASGAGSRKMRAEKEMINAMAISHSGAMDRGGRMMMGGTA